jgi:hypothetical protein
MSSRGLGISSCQAVRAALILTCTVIAAGCSGRRASEAAPTPPPIIAHAEWEAQPPLGHTADANRRNLRAGDSLVFRDLTITVTATEADSTGDTPFDLVRLRLTRGNDRDTRAVREGAAFNWHGFHIAVIAVYGPGELGGGLAVIEVGTLATIPPEVASSDSAGGAALRLRVPHRITHVTLHHTGSSEPLRPDDDPAEKLRGLQSWGARDRNWWDVPYHYLIDLEGRVYEGRDWHFMGETNTTYDPSGHFLISVIGNYGKQEATPAQLDAIADLMAWAIAEFDLPLDRIGGHYDYAGTNCPGTHLRKYLEDGTFRRMVEQRLAHR